MDLHSWLQRNHSSLQATCSHTDKHLSGETDTDRSGAKGALDASFTFLLHSVLKTDTHTIFLKTISVFYIRINTALC